MKLLNLRLRHIKGFDNLDLSFTTDGRQPRPWTLLLGDNASGKTTVLRCLAIGLNDESSAAGLVREMKTSFVRKVGKPSEGVIIVGLVDSHGTHWTLKTVLTPIPKTGDRVRQRVYRLPAHEVPDGAFSKLENEPGFISIEDFPWEKLFVCGYGAGRSVDGREEYSDYRTVDAVYTLFRYDQPLQSPEIGWRRYRQRVLEQKFNRQDEVTSTEWADERISELLGTILEMAESGRRPVLREDGIHLRYGNRWLPLADHADGYRSVTTWLLDFVSWFLLYHKKIQLENIEGVVLVDEIEQHLHPRWQRYLISRLFSQLKNVQFVSTTHSPLCIAGAADLTADQSALTRLKFVEKSQRIFATELSLPYARRADEILMSDAFDLKETINPTIGDRLAEYRKLFKSRGLSAEDQKRKTELEKWLQEHASGLLQFSDNRELVKELSGLIKKARELRTEDTL